MKAIVIQNFGSPEKFEKIDLPIPTPIDGQVLVKVAATSINPLDIKIRSGVYGALAPKFPAILQGDFAGVVEAVSEGSPFQIGDEVFGCTGGVINNSGALAEYIAVDSSMIAKKPKLLSFLEAAALPLVAITASSALIDELKVQSGEKVLIQAGAGGVGHIAIQIAKLLGADVYSTVSTEEKANLVSSLGATPIFYKSENLEDYVKRCTGGNGFDVVFDTVGGVGLDASLKAAAHKGRVATIQGAALHDLTPVFKKELTLKGILMLNPILMNKGRERHGVILKQIAEWVDQGKLKPVVDPHQFKLDEVESAHRFFEKGSHLGKVVISVS